MRESARYTNMAAKAATGVGNNIFVKDFRHLIASIDAVVGAGEAVTIKCQGSVSDDSPDFSAAQSVANQWDYIQIVDQESGSTIDGDTGITISSADDNRQVAINIDGLNWLNFELSSITGTIAVTVDVQAYND